MSVRGTEDGESVRSGLKDRGGGKVCLAQASA